MGLYYNPIPPHIGAQQPLTPRKLTPPISGPASTNPPFPGAQVAQAVLVSWAVLTIPPAPVVARNLTPPSAPVPAPLFKRYEYAVHNAWIPPPPAPQTGINLDPPVSGPPPQNPPFMGGARISQPVLNAWLPPAPMPVLPVLIDPPISGPQNPPFPGTRVPVEVQVSWLPAPFAPISAGKIGAVLPPPPAVYSPIGSRVPMAVQVAWLPPAPMPLLPINLDPPRSGPPINNPFFPGARVPVAVQVSWLPLPPRPPAVINRGIATVPVNGVLAASEAADTAQITVQVRSDAPGILNFGRRVTINRW